MKKTIISLTTLFLIVLVTINIVSCQKEKTSSHETNRINTLSKEKTLANIIEFRKQLETHRKNPGAKTGEILSLQEAILDIENVFNATYSQPEVLCSETSEFTFSLYLAIDTDGNVLLSDLFDLYDQAVVEARNAYSNDGFTNKVFCFMTVELGGINGGLAKLDFRGRSGEGDKSPWQPFNDSCMYYGPFEFDDNYHYDYGKCDGTGVDGADEILTYYVGHYIASRLTTPPVGMRAVYINTIDIILYGSDYPNNLFFRTNINATCIDFNNLNRLYNTEINLITNLLPNDPQSSVYGMTPVGIIVYSDHGFDSPYIAHNNRVTYSWRVIADLDDIGEVEDLLIDQNTK